MTADQTTLTSLVSRDPIYAYLDVDEQTLLRIQQMIREEVSDKGIRQATTYLRQQKLDEETVRQAVRPIFSWVISLVILLGGAVAVLVLPVAQYPDLTPPTVSVSASYPGANAQVVADSVAAPIEQQVNGVDHMMYMSSQCTNDDNYTLTVTFEIGTDPNMNQVLVQNRVSLATAQLPTQVQIQGLNVKKKSPDLLLVVNL